MSDRLKVLLQYVLPKRRLSTLAGRIADARPLVERAGAVV